MWLLLNILNYCIFVFKRQSQFSHGIFLLNKVICPSCEFMHFSSMGLKSYFNYKWKAMWSSHILIFLNDSCVKKAASPALPDHQRAYWMQSDYWQKKRWRRQWRSISSVQNRKAHRGNNIGRKPGTKSLWQWKEWKQQQQHITQWKYTGEKKGEGLRMIYR